MRVARERRREAEATNWGRRRSMLFRSGDLLVWFAIRTPPSQCLGSEAFSAWIPHLVRSEPTQMSLKACFVIVFALGSTIFGLASLKSPDSLSRQSRLRLLDPVIIPTCTFDQQLQLIGANLTCAAVNCTAKYFGTRNLYNSTVGDVFFCLLVCKQAFVRSTLRTIAAGR